MSDIDRIRRAYTRFLLPGRILLSGHSHQAWPDVAREAQLEAFDDSARYVDEKWQEAVFPLVDEVGRGILVRMGCAPEDGIAFAESTHALLVRLLSAYDRSQLTVVTTSGEFHSMDRQLRRYAEDGMRLVTVPARPRDDLAARLVAAVEREARDGAPTLVAFSAVLFEDAWVQHEVAGILESCVRVGATPVVDAYHAFNAVPLEWGPALERTFLLGGGYKYAGFGNALCWLRIPRDCELRPADTGWFSDFASLSEPRDLPGGARRPVGYGPGASRFAGATFEATPFYRARAVLRHWGDLGLGVPELRAISTRQTRRIIDGLRGRGVLDGGGRLELASADDDARRGAFVAVRHPQAAALSRTLLERQILTDSRGDLLRLGPAPYVRDEEIEHALDALAALVR